MVLCVLRLCVGWGWRRKKVVFKRLEFFRVWGPQRTNPLRKPHSVQFSSPPRDISIDSPASVISAGIWWPIMAVAIVQPNGVHVHGGESEESSHVRPAKRLKATEPAAAVQLNPEGKESEDSSVVRRHPLGVRPSGNALTSAVNLKVAAGRFALLPDEFIAQFLEILDAKDLLRLGGTCRALHAFTRNEELWRALFVE